MKSTWLGQRMVSGGVALLVAIGLACSDGDSLPSPETFEPGNSDAEAQSEPEASSVATAAPESTSRPEQSPSPTPDPSYVLPDIETGPSDDIYISITAAGVRLLHFNTNVHNTGDGPLEVTSDQDTGRTAPALQVIQTRDAGHAERDIGQLQLNDEHGHWHLDDFADYELWGLAGEDELDEIVAFSEKVTFCLIDEFPLHEDGYGDGPHYGPCDPYVQGISPGWGETYEAWLPGQSLDITDLPDGHYALRTVLDPEGKILESDKDNNVYVMYLYIEGTHVEPAGASADEESALEAEEEKPL